jgi:hypothetical protein
MDPPRSVQRDLRYTVAKGTDSLPEEIEMGLGWPYATAVGLCSVNRMYCGLW